MNINNSNNPKQIIIAEDSPTQAQRLKFILEGDGYEVISTTNGRMALEAIMRERPSAVVSDVLMPEMSGYELCRAVKSDSKLKSIPVILLTTLSDAQDVIRGLECGADNFVVKPYDERYLLSRVQLVLQSKEVAEDGTGGVVINYGGKDHRITAGGRQILNLLLSTYEAAVQRNDELLAAREALGKANVSLEAANRELEAFSYSVSHDLRAPLRAIEGFLRHLSNQHEQALPEDGRAVLQRAMNACQRMGQLIEDLLNLSRVTSSEMRREHVDLSAMARSIFSDLQNASPERSVQVDIAPEIFVEADARLLRAALENLLGNAWKFTGKRPDAKIQVGATQVDNEQVIFVKDNGAGFDSNYADKLFGAFQRLHTQSEFPGTGVGLATVRRIIQRHGGRIWAESVVGEGATFRFTILGSA